jgi:hypothetical protein
MPELAIELFGELMLSTQARFGCRHGISKHCLVTHHYVGKYNVLTEECEKYPNNTECDINVVLQPH